MPLVVKTFCWKLSARNSLHRWPSFAPTLKSSASSSFSICHSTDQEQQEPPLLFSKDHSIAHTVRGLFSINHSIAHTARRRTRAEVCGGLTKPNSSERRHSLEEVWTHRLFGTGKNQEVRKSSLACSGTSVAENIGSVTRRDSWLEVSKGSGMEGVSAVRGEGGVQPQAYRYLCVLDFEATCDEDKSFGPMEIIEFPVVVLDTRTLDTVAEFHHYCRPQKNPVLTPFCSTLTGITQAQVDAGLPFAEVLGLLDEFLSSFIGTDAESREGALLFVTCGDWDLQRMLPRQMGLSDLPTTPPYLRKWANIKDLFYSLYKANDRRAAVGMVSMLSSLGLPLVGHHHSGIDDSRNIAAIVRLMLEDGCVFQATAGFDTPPGEPCNGQWWRLAGNQRVVQKVRQKTTPTPAATSAAPPTLPPLLWGSEPGQVRMCDVGANLAHASLRDAMSDVLSRAAEAGVGEIIVTGTSVSASRTSLGLCQDHQGGDEGVLLRCTAGIHPHDASRAVAHGLGDGMASLARLAAEHPGVVCAVGECGLDFDRNFSTREDQVAVFEAQIELAKTTGLPLFLHERAAHAEFLRILTPHATSVRGVAHCFTGTLQEMRAYLDLGLYIGITGWVCDERRAHDLTRAIPHLPLERLLIETDAPFLLPRNVPRDAMPKHTRKSRTNEPAMLPWVAQRISELRGCSLADVVQASTRNAHALFGSP